MDASLMPKYYRMNPKFEEVLPSGSHLSNGMTVLIENPDNRTTINDFDDLSDWLKDRALESNRWCTISNLHEVNGGTSIRFVATYEDGCQRIRTLAASHAWIVKRNTSARSAEKYAQVYGVVSGVIRKTMGDDASDPVSARMVMADRATREILDFFGMGEPK
jgi:hypothetical protein